MIRVSIQTVYTCYSTVINKNRNKQTYFRKRKHETVWIEKYFTRGNRFYIFFLFILSTAIDTAGADDGDTLERLRNITKMFTAKDDEPQQLKKMEKLAPSDKIKNTFQK